MTCFIALFFFCEAMKQFFEGLNNQNLPTRQRSFKKLLGLTILFSCFMIWSIMPNLISFWRLSDAGLISNTDSRPSTIELPNPLLHYIPLTITAVSTFLVIFLFAIIKIYYDDELSKHEKKPKEQQSAGTRIVTFAREMRLRVTKKSDTYYESKNKDAMDSEIVKVEDEEALCMLCYDNPNEVIIKPCGHSGVCKPCMLDYIKEKKTCHMCMAPFDSFLIFYYDKAKKGYYTKEAIKI